MQSIVGHILDFSTSLSCVRSAITYVKIIVEIIIIIINFIILYDMFDILVFEIDLGFVNIKEIIELEIINTGS